MNQNEESTECFLIKFWMPGGKQKALHMRKSTCGLVVALALAELFRRTDTCRLLNRRDILSLLSIYSIKEIMRFGLVLFGRQAILAVTSRACYRESNFKHP